MAAPANRLTCEAPLAARVDSMQCPSCQNPVDPAFRFCPNCGALAAEAPAANEPGDNSELECALAAIANQPESPGPRTALAAAFEARGRTQEAALQRNMAERLSSRASGSPLRGLRTAAIAATAVGLVVIGVGAGQMMARTQSPTRQAGAFPSKPAVDSVSSLPVTIGVPAASPSRTGVLAHTTPGVPVAGPSGVSLSGPGTAHPAAGGSAGQARAASGPPQTTGTSAWPASARRVGLPEVVSSRPKAPDEPLTAARVGEVIPGTVRPGTPGTEQVQTGVDVQLGSPATAPRRDGGDRKTPERELPETETGFIRIERGTGAPPRETGVSRGPVDSPPGAALEAARSQERAGSEAVKAGLSSAARRHYETAAQLYLAVARSGSADSATAQVRWEYCQRVLAALR